MAACHGQRTDTKLSGITAEWRPACENYTIHCAPSWRSPWCDGGLYLHLAAYAICQCVGALW